MLLNCGVGEDSWESLGLQGDQTSQSQRKSVLNIHRKDWCWSWNSNTLATWCEELTCWKRPCCCKRLKAGGEGYDRWWDSWMASPTWWTRVSASSRSWWWTGKPAVLQSMGSQKVGHDRATELNWTGLPPLRCWSYQHHFLSHALTSVAKRWWSLYKLGHTTWMKILLSGKFHLVYLPGGKRTQATQWLPGSSLLFRKRKYFLILWGQLPVHSLKGVPHVLWSLGTLSRAEA